MATKAYGREKGETQPCYLTHKVLEIGGGKVVGGRCGNPITQEADVYISFDSMSHPVLTAAFPWYEGESFCYPIVNGKTPADLDEWRNMVAWAISLLEEGKTIHCGCIGGHGRTGLFLAALVAHICPPDVTYTTIDGISYVDATKYVRENYCPKVVETQPQVDFLFEHHKVTPVVASYVARAKAAGAEPIVTH